MGLDRDRILETYLVITETARHVTAEERTKWNGKASVADIGSVHIWEQLSNKSFYTIKFGNKTNIKTSASGTTNYINKYQNSFWSEIDVSSGSIMLKNNLPASIAVGSSTAEAMAGKFFKDGTKIYLIVNYSGGSWGSSNTSVQFNVKPVSVISTSGLCFDKYVSSLDADQYPKHGTQGGYFYNYVGKIPEVERTEVVSYVGTGTYGSDNPCSVTAKFPIKVAFMVGMLPGSISSDCVSNVILANKINAYQFSKKLDSI